MRKFGRMFRSGLVRDVVPPLTRYEQTNNDTQYYHVNSGSLVIPKPHVKKVQDFLKREGLRLTTQSNSISPTPVKLVYGELIIDRQDKDIQQKVITFLKANNIHLPNT